MQAFNPTRKGDDGLTHMFGKRIPKTTKSVKLVGELDYLQAQLGELYTMIPKTSSCIFFLPFLTGKYDELRDDVAFLTKQIYNINSIFWNPKVATFDVDALEIMLKQYTFKPLTKFQLPLYDDAVVAKINLLRAETRKVELIVLEILDNIIELEYYSSFQLELLKKLAAWLNRLSSVFYAMINHLNANPVFSCH
jgi:cob(I)alamin adenosyltransferase